MTNSHVATMNKNFSIIKWILALGLLSGAVIGFQLTQQHSILIRVIGLLGLTGLALFVASTTPQGQRALEFIQAAKAEAKRVVWPTRQETMQMTGIVVVMVLIVTLFVWLVDSLLIVAMTWFTG
jgi:preprotein translocase subunit SecE